MKNSITKFQKWSRRIFGHRFISIRTKFTLSLVSLLVLFGGISSYMSYNYVIRMNDKEMSKKGNIIFGVIHEQLTNALIHDDIVFLHKFIQGIKEKDPDILYIIVIDRNNRIMTHTFEYNMIPQYLISFIPEDTVNNFIDRKQHLYIRQYNYPVLEGKLGYLLMGLDESNIIKKGTQIALILGGMIIAFLIIGIIAAYILSTLITYPIFQIIKGFKHFVPGKSLPNLTVWSNDETMLLFRGFQDMMKRISLLHHESRETQLKIIETEKFANVGVLASGIAHEINNPVAGIEMCVHRLQRVIPREHEKQQEYICLIAEAVQHIKTIVRDLLNYAHQPDRKEEQIDLRSVIEFSIKLLQYRLEKRRINLKINTPSSPCIISGVMQQLVRITVNGIMNAIDAIGEKGEITIILSQEKKSYTLVIKDSGHGVPPEIKDRIFDPFFTTKGTEGTGLGLYVSYNMVKAHNGTISLTSPSDGGAQLKISLPKEEVIK